MNLFEKELIHLNQKDLFIINTFSGHFPNLQEELKSVMAGEMEVVVQEEK